MGFGEGYERFTPSHIYVPATTKERLMYLPLARHRNRLRVSSVVAVGAAVIAMTSAVGAVQATHASADSMTYQVTNYDNDGTTGVYGRNSADINNVNRDAAHFLGYGTSINLLCGLFGSAVGPYNNTAWDEVQVVDGPNSGLTTYLPEHWLNTPVGSDQHVSGEPACGGGPSSTAQAAINWANGHLGQSYDSGYCLAFVAEAYSAAGVNIGGSDTAADYWSSDPNGYPRHSDASPEVGSLVFWGATAANYAGHVGIYLGNDTVISTSSWPESSSGTTVHTWSFSGRNAAGYPYLGWMHIA
ncbi:MAG: CHAP domain-containing protein [Jatrophihabitans sp.]